MNNKKNYNRSDKYYDWYRISEEARVISNCEKLGAVDLNSVSIKTMKPIKGFNRGQI